MSQNEHIFLHFIAKKFRESVNTILKLFCYIFSILFLAVTSPKIVHIIIEIFSHSWNGLSSEFIKISTISELNIEL